MPLIYIEGLPRPVYQNHFAAFGELRREIVHLTSRHLDLPASAHPQVTVRFPGDLLTSSWQSYIEQSGEKMEVVIRVVGMFAMRRRTPELRQHLAQKLAHALKAWLEAQSLPFAVIECLFDPPYERKNGFYQLTG